ncbi:unnamed protein product [Camellia sinensis]
MQKLLLFSTPPPHSSISIPKSYSHQFHSLSLFSPISLSNPQRPWLFSHQIHRSRATMETSKRRERVFRDFHYLLPVLNSLWVFRDFHYILPVLNSLNTHHDGSVLEGRETEAKDAD